MFLCNKKKQWNVKHCFISIYLFQIKWLLIVASFFFHFLWPFFPEQERSVPFIWVTPHAKDLLLLHSCAATGPARGGYFLLFFFTLLQGQSGYRCGWIGLGGGRGVSDSCAKPCSANTIMLIHSNVHLFTHTFLSESRVPSPGDRGAHIKNTVKIRGT